MKKMWNQIGQPRPLLLMKLKLWQGCKTFFFSQNVLRPCHALSKILISSTAGGLGHPIWFHNDIFFILAFFSSWLLLFYTMDVLVEIEICISENCLIFFILIFLLRTSLKNNLSQEKQPSHGLISFKFGTLIKHIMDILA